MGTFNSQAYIHESVAISLVKVYERVGFVTDSFLKDSAFTAVTRDANFLTRYVKWVPFVNRM